ncbi:MAG: T9SS type A sorting domain-containing protein, partial [Bacteroidota bacterium]
RLLNGQKYRFEFDAYAVANRTIDVKVAMIAAPNTNYSKSGSFYLTTAKKHFSYDFTMGDATDNNARIVFNCGLSDVDVFIDNVSVKQLVPAGTESGNIVLPDGFELHQNYPNPFNPSTTIRYALPVKCRVTLQIYNVLGQVLATLVNNVKDAGWHQAAWNAAASSGIYFYRIEAVGNEHPNVHFLQVRKMILMQ